MNKLTLSKGIKMPTPKPNLFGLPQPLVGAFIGFISFLLLTILTKETVLAMGLLFPGGFIWQIIELSTSTFSEPKFGYEIVVYGISGIPSAIIGLFVFSSNKDIRLVGILLLAWYLILAFLVGGFIYASLLA